MGRSTARIVGTCAALALGSIVAFPACGGSGGQANPSANAGAASSGAAGAHAGSAGRAGSGSAAAGMSSAAAGMSGAAGGMSGAGAANAGGTAGEVGSAGSSGSAGSAGSSGSGGAQAQCVGSAPACRGTDIQQCCGQDPYGSATCQNGAWVCSLFGSTHVPAPGCNGQLCGAQGGAGAGGGAGTGGGAGASAGQAGGGGGACAGQAPRCFGSNSNSCCAKDPGGQATCQSGTWLCSGVPAPGCNGQSCI